MKPDEHEFKVMGYTICKVKYANEVYENVLRLITGQKLYGSS